MAVTHVGEALRRLLAEPGARERWLPYRTRLKGREVRPGAVAGAVAAHLGCPARTIKDRIGDAVGGRIASPKTIEQLVDTFGWGGQRQAWLLRLLDDDDAAGQLRLRERLPEGGSRPFRTSMLHEFHQLGPLGFPVLHQTVVTIESEIDGLSHIEYRYLPEPGVISVLPLDGGTVESTHDREDGIRVTDIRLFERLATGATAGISWETRFDEYYDDPLPVFQRGVSAQVSAVEVKVGFDRARLPRSVFESEWAEHGAPPVVEHRRHLDAAGCVQLFRERPATGFLGFRWEWP